MRKLGLSLLVISIILLMVGHSFAQPPRQPTTSEGKSGFTNIAVRGLNKDGVDDESIVGLPGYMEMTSTKGDVFYLYIGYNGNLLIASDVVLGAGASPTIAGWADASGVIVGLQTHIQ